MASAFHRAQSKNLIHPPKWIKDNLHYEVVTGSDAYGVSSGSSDIDIYGWCIPPKHFIFPNLGGYVAGFGPQPDKFDQFIQHHVDDKETSKEYDFTIYNVVKYLDLCAQNNPNMIDTLFVPQRCILSASAIGLHVRENRKMFLHKGSWFKFKGYAYSQLQKLDNKVGRTDATTKRQARIDEFGYDTKHGYHIVRLINEVEQIMTEGDLDLERSRTQLKDIRAGNWSLDHLREWFEKKEISLEETYNSSKLPHGPDWKSLTSLLMDVLEMHYGSLSEAVTRDKNVSQLVTDLETLIERYK